MKLRIGRRKRSACSISRMALAPALLTFHARAADLLESEDTGNDRLRAHLGRVDQVLPFLGTRGISLGALWDAKDAKGLRGVSSN